MHFYIEYELSPDTRDEAQKRFLEAGGLPPAGITMLQRWHYASGHRGFIIAQADDAIGIGKWMQDWTDLLVFDITPILSDEEFQQVIQQ
jgi:hypothetical protein